MPHLSMIDRYREYQRAACALMDEARSHLNSAHGPDPTSLSMLRWQMARVLIEFASFKHRAIFGPLMESGQPEDAAIGARLKGDCLKVTRAFRQYVMQWSATDTRGCWSDYARAAKAMMTELRTHFEQERAQLDRMAGAQRL